MEHAMSKALRLTLPLLALAAGGAALEAAPGGPIDYLPLGDYICELPGDATGPAGIRQPDQGFSVINATTYTTATGRGSYLLTGDRLVLTSGPKRGQRFHRLSQNFLREMTADGRDGSLRCVRQVTNNR